MPRFPAPSGATLRPLVRSFGIAFLVLFGLASTWSLATPLLGGPDEPWHGIRAAGVASGQIVGEMNDEPGLRVFDVPTYLHRNGGTEICYAFDPDVTADCLPAIEGSRHERGDMRTTAGPYDPTYFALVGWPTLVLDGEAAWYGMRFASAALVSAVAASGFAALLARSRRGWALIGATLGVTPMVTFLCSVVNPSALEISSAFALACWLALLVDRRRDDLVPIAIAGVGVTSILLMHTRMIGMAWAALVIAAFLLEARIWPRLLRSRWFWTVVGLMGVSAGLSVVWTLRSGLLETAGRFPGAGEVTFLEGFEFMLSKTLEFGTGYVGYFGWMDTPLPPTAVGVWIGLMVALVAGALLFGRGPSRWKALVLVVAFVLIPPIVQGSAWYDIGYIWQPRYVLAVLVVVLVAAGVALDDAVPAPSALPHARRLFVTFAVTVGAVHVFAFLWSLKRYVVGLLGGDGWTLMVTAPQWQPPLGWVTLGLLEVAVVTIALVLLRVALAGDVSGADEQPEAVADVAARPPRQPVRPRRRPIRRAASERGT